MDLWISGMRDFITWLASSANAKMASVKLSSSVARAGGLALLVLLSGCSTPAEVSCLAGESPCHGACVPAGTACPGVAVDMAAGACSIAAECPIPATACQAGVCSGGTCGTTNRVAGTPCNDSGGDVCDGSGSCVVGCSLPTDCPATSTACVANLCSPTAHLCMLVDAPAGAPCNDNGGSACDGNGACVAPAGAPGAACTTSAQCASGLCGPSGGGSHCCAQPCPSGPCGAVDCDTSGACVLMPMNAPCGAGLCNGTGTCVLPCGQSMYKCVFVTSQAYDGNLGGTTGADATCAAVASGAGLTGAFGAWLSVTGSDANTRVGTGTQPYQLLDGTPLAANSAALSGGSLLNPIDRDETGSLVGPVDVWTNTNPDGTLYAAGACGDFTSNLHTDTPLPAAGSSGAANATWTDNQMIFCDATARLYCFEQ